MLNFIIPLKARAVSSDWDSVCDIFETTLRSVCNQTDPGFRVTVVCHEKPALRDAARFDSCVDFVEVGFAVPDLGRPGSTMKDKWRKLTVGYMHARELQPDFTMNVDADDLISNRLAAHANADRQANGWIMHEGYFFDYGAGRLLRRTNFHGVCGTSAILSTRTYQFPENGDLDEDELFERARQQCAPLRYGHTIIETYMAQNGTPLALLPFPGAIYVFGHADNETRVKVTGAPPVKLINRLGKIKRAAAQLPRRQAVTAALRQEFGIPESN